MKITKLLLLGCALVAVSQANAHNVSVPVHVSASGIFPDEKGVEPKLAVRTVENGWFSWSETNAPRVVIPTDNNRTEIAGDANPMQVTEGTIVQYGFSGESPEKWHNCGSPIANVDGLKEVQLHLAEDKVDGHKCKLVLRK